MNPSFARILDGMVRVEGGSFHMGDAKGDFAQESRPVHAVMMDGYFIHACAVTQSIWSEVMDPNASGAKDSRSSRKPVARVSWYDSIRFCNRLSLLLDLDPCYEMDGEEVRLLSGRHGIRLPTEAEWEYAARGGAKSRTSIYAGGNEIDDVAWYRGNSGGVIHEVMEKRSNELGLFDMSGNVWEWCWDWFGNYASDSVSNPSGPENGERKVYRGGSYFDFAYGCTVAVRGHRSPRLGYVDVGFRVARSIP